MADHIGLPIAHSMKELAEAGILLALLLAATYAGFWLQKPLRERHLTPDTVQSIRLVTTIMVTFTGIVLGLLLTAMKTSFDAEAQTIRAFSEQLIELDARLREYGPDAQPMRQMLRRYTATAIADTWPGERPPSGIDPRSLSVPRSTFETKELTDLLMRIDVSAMRLKPANAYQQQVAALIRQAMDTTLRTRWRWIESAVSTIAWPFLILVMLWLAIIFTIFALTSPRNALMQVVIALSALSLASIVFIILELDTPFTGLMVVSSQPLRDAVEHMDRPALSPAAGPAIRSSSP